MKALRWSNAKQGVTYSFAWLTDCILLLHSHKHAQLNTPTTNHHLRHLRLAIHCCILNSSTVSSLFFVSPDKNYDSHDDDSRARLAHLAPMTDPDNNHATSKIDYYALQ